jgi:HEAT repeat protein
MNISRILFSYLRSFNLSNNNKKLFEEIEAMDQKEAVNSLLSVLTSSKDLEDKLKSVDILAKFEDNENSRLKDIKITFLNDKHPQLRIKLIDLFARIYGNEGIKFLKEQYKNCSDGTVRKNLIEKVGNADLNGSIPFFIEVLGDPNIEASELAINLLGKSGSKEALVPLIERLHFRNPNIYNPLINSIVKIGKKGYHHIVHDYIDTEDVYIRREIPVILGKMGNKESETALISFLKEENPLIRKNSLKALEKIIELKNIKYVLVTLNDQDLDVRKESIRVLGNIGSKRAISPLSELLKDNDTKIRNLAKNALYKIIKKSKSNDVLYDILKGKNIYARREAIKLLGMLKDENAIDTLIKTFNSTVASIRRASYRAILQILQKKIDERVINSLTAKSWRIRMYCTKILGEIGDLKTIGAVFKLIEDEHGSVRKAAIDALINFNSSDVVEMAISSLKNSNWKIRRAGVKLLIRVGSKDSINSLISCLEDDDVYVKSWAAMALGKIKEVDSIEPFIQLLKENDDKIRLSAIKALGEIGNKDAIKSLIEILGDDNWNIKKEAENALNQIDPDWMNEL